MKTYIDLDTGELFVAFSLADWERIAKVARRVDPCTPGACTNPACRLAVEVLAADVAMNDAPDSDTPPILRLRAEA